MSPRSVVVTGANRGIGLGLIHQFIKNPDIKHIIATARDVDKATELASINDPRLHILPLVLNCDESIDKFATKVSDIVGDDGLNLVINNAAIMVYHSVKDKPNRELLLNQFNVNTVSVVILTQTLLPLLQKAAAKSTGSSLSVSRAAVVNISSGYSSITNNTEPNPSVLSYRMSKTALNQFTKTLSIDVKDDHILTVNMLPGWVKTDMGGPNADWTVEQSTSALVDSFYKLNEEHNGGYYSRHLELIIY